MAKIRRIKGRNVPLDPKKKSKPVTVSLTPPTIQKIKTQQKKRIDQDKTGSFSKATEDLINK